MPFKNVYPGLPVVIAMVPILVIYGLGCNLSSFERGGPPDEFNCPLTKTLYRNRNIPRSLTRPLDPPSQLYPLP
uniref:Uncharacterized protein n=1 Tax=Picea glauca TaxID=3330 RepID=A0A101LYP0_PICGL|nr:hypothetical protein ABT39_MTgene4778 [Picea glauca]QHR92007.1 hypothetical protein Q903MT_gene6043 [Picea sitchensis]